MILISAIFVDENDTLEIQSNFYLIDVFGRSKVLCHIPNVFNINI